MSKVKKTKRKTSKKPLEDEDSFILDRSGGPDDSTVISPLDFSTMMDNKILENSSNRTSDYMYSSATPDIEIDINKIEDKKKPVPEKKIDESNGIKVTTSVGEYTNGGAPEDYLDSHWPEDPDGLMGDMTLENQEKIPVDSVNPSLHSLPTDEVPIEKEFSNFAFTLNAMYNFQSFIFNTADSYLYQTGRTKQLGLGEKFAKEHDGFINCYAQIIKKHGDHWIVELITDPIFLWGNMSLGIIAAHVVENGVNKNKAN